MICSAPASHTLAGWPVYVARVPAAPLSIIIELRQTKLAGRKIGIGKTKTVVIGVDRAEIIGPFCFEQIQLAYRPSADDLGNVAIDDPARLRFACLIADRHSPAGFD